MVDGVVVVGRAEEHAELCLVQATGIGRVDLRQRSAPPLRGRRCAGSIQESGDLTEWAAVHQRIGMTVHAAPTLIAAPEDLRHP